VEKFAVVRPIMILKALYAAARRSGVLQGFPRTKVHMDLEFPRVLTAAGSFHTPQMCSRDGGLVDRSG
jgi:hypothetical protein